MIASCPSLHSKLKTSNNPCSILLIRFYIIWLFYFMKLWRWELVSWGNQFFKWLDYWFDPTGIQFERVRLPRFHVINKILMHLTWGSSGSLSFSKFFQMMQGRGIIFLKGTNSLKWLKYLFPNGASRFHFIYKMSESFKCLRLFWAFINVLKLYLGAWPFFKEEVFVRIKFLNLP